MSQVQVPQRQDLLTSSNFVETRDENGNLTGYNLMGNDGQVISSISSTMGPQYVGPTTRANPFSDGTYEINWGENNAMTTILARGRKADGTWDIGWTQGMMGNNITQEQMNDFETLQSYNTLSSKYDKDLIANGQSPVSFGEGESSVTRRLQQAINAPEAKRLETQRVEGLKSQALSEANASIRADNQEASVIQRDEANAGERKEIREDEKTEAQKNRDWQIGVKELENKAEMDRYEMMLEREERRDRRDSIGQLVAGLAALGGAFAL